jgi:hypothetical protein
MDTAGEPVNRNRTIINLAYEGVPRRAIARALQLPANEVGEVVADAVARGVIVEPSESELAARVAQAPTSSLCRTSAR